MVVLPGHPGAAGSDGPVIFGAHLVVFSTDAEADRAFLSDVFGFDSVDAGGGWLIFAASAGRGRRAPGRDAGRPRCT